MPCYWEIGRQLGEIEFACAYGDLGLASSRANGDFCCGTIYVNHRGVR